MHPIIKNHLACTSKVNQTIVGVETNSVSIRNEVSVTLRPWFESDETVSGHFLVMPPKHTWKSMLPEQDLSNNYFKGQFPVEQLADPLFWKSSPIQLILGIEIWSQIIKDPIIQMGPKLVCQESRFGKIVMGSIESKSIKITNGSYSVKIEKK